MTENVLKRKLRFKFDPRFKCCTIDSIIVENDKIYFVLKYEKNNNSNIKSMIKRL